MLGRLRDGTAEAERTLATVRALLPRELAREVWGAAVKEGTLTVLVRSAAWGTRLRYLAPSLNAALAAALGGEIDRIKVKVRAGGR